MPSHRYHLSNRTKIDQNRTKFGPLFSSNPDLNALNPDKYHKIIVKPDFFENFRRFQRCKTSTSSLNL